MINITLEIVFRSCNKFCLVLTFEYLRFLIHDEKGCESCMSINDMTM